MLTKQQAGFALEWGWKKRDLHRIHENGCNVTYITPHFMVLDEKWHIYRQFGLQPLAKYQHLREVVAYCDGSGTNPRKYAGIGVVLESPELDETALLSINVNNGTNNYAELWAIYVAIMHVPNNQARITIKSDSAYSIGVLVNQDWTLKFNQDLIQAMREDLKLRPNVSFEKVKGHSGIYGNEMADALAGVARKYANPHPGWL